MKIDKDKLKESLTEEEIIEILEHLGCERYKQHRNYIAFSTSVCHGGEHLNLVYKDETKNFYCYSECKCAYDIYGLIQKNKDISFPEAIKFVSDLVNRTYEFEEIDEEDLVDDWRWIKKLKRKTRRKYEEHQILDIKILQQYIHLPHLKWYNDGISIQTQNKWGVFYDLKTSRICYGFYDENNNLVGIKGRVEDDEIEPKYLYLYPCNKTNLLIGLNINLPNILEQRKIIVFESYKSVLLADQYGYNYAVSIEGSDLSDWQQKKLLSLDCEVIIALDKGLDYSHLTDIKNRLKGKTELSFIFDKWDLLQDKMSPVDIKKETFDYLFKNRFKIK